ncbi:MAG: GNAT family N-acetyltransferase [Oscillospiraceae bacterium]|nr:GNAT family N-acetyltransferase [Oscillospiraceae bacterium]
MVGLRQFRPEDAALIRRWEHPDLSLEEIVETIAAWNAGSHQGRPFEMFAVVAEGRIVGRISLLGLSPSLVSLGPEIWPEERRKGYGRAAMVLLMERAAEKGYRIVLQQVRRDNAASVALHEGLGFESDGYGYRNRWDREVVLYLKAL